MTLREEQFIRIMLSGKKPKASRTSELLISKIGRSSGRGGGLSSMGSKRNFIREKRTRLRRVVVKAFILKNNHKGTSWTERRQKHAHYIQREGVSKEAQQGVAYGPGFEPLEVSSFIKRGHSDAHEFRFILSAEDASQLDLTDFTKTLMKSLEKDLGTKLDWMASNHYNTDSPHTHIVLRGSDENGEKLILDRDTISNGIRNRASEIVTRELGERTREEIEHEIKSSISKNRATHIDFEIEKRIDFDGIYALQDGPQIQGVLIAQKYQEQRLLFLQTQGLAQKISSERWKFKSDWIGQLKEKGFQGDIIKMMHRDNGVHEQNCVVYKKEIHGQMPLMGVVVQRGISNEMTDKEFLIIKAQDNRYYFVDLDLDSKSSQAQVGNSVQVSLTEPTPWIKKSDLNLEEFTRSSGGVYDAQKHQAWAKSVGITHEDYVKVHLKRLMFLEKLDLAKKQAHGQWKLNPDFLERLERLEKEQKETFKPRLSVRVASMEPKQEQKLKPVFSRWP